MRTYPENLEDEEVTELNADKWQLDLLKLNPHYVYWGVYEDSMSTEESWRGRVINENWEDFEFTLDVLNEVVNFYFEVYREGHRCEHCGGTDLNTATKKIEDDWYDFDGKGTRWCDNITEVEALALLKKGRIEDENGNKKWYEDTDEEPNIDDLPSLESINKNHHEHDAINRWICVEARAKHLGVYGKCEHCVGGTIYDQEQAKVALQLWVLHPRKGASRGVYVKEIKREEIPEVIKYLQEAEERNRDRFKNIIDYQQIERDNTIEEILK